ncbi:helix-turn-helix domain-containing protein [Modicisalibacter coralii]|uniref:helix-turn-helix domain-containing protein n=1 Tax=Modicisalibacter coralii TaxID=2304602 RepID=UPI00100A78DF|nr:helix-turn-helix domain-containing protein [Halomonas coralii]
MSDPTPHIAATLKALRQGRGWSLTRCAQATGVSKAMLGQIERGESSPTVATLWKIAGGFGVSLSAFLVGESPPATSAPPPLRDSVGMQVSVLVPFDAQLGLEMFAVELAPGACSESSAHGSGVVEHVIVVDGVMAVAEAGRWRHLAAGDVARLQADRPHGYRNDGERVARFHNLVHYPR